MNCQWILLLMAGVAIPIFSTEFSVTGVVKDTEGNVIENALIRFENAGYVTVSNSSGGFILSDVSPVFTTPERINTTEEMVVENGYLHLLINGSKSIVVSVYTLQGKLCIKKQINNLTKGNYTARLGSLLPYGMKTGTYIIVATIGSKRIAEKILHRGEEKSPFSLHYESKVFETNRMARTNSVVDTIIISKLGYVTKSLQVESFQANIGTVILERSTILDNTTSIARIEDSLMNLLLERIRDIEYIDGPDELKTIDYISIRNGFEAVLEKDSLRVKSNIGYMISALASLNVNGDVWKIADSLDAYFNSLGDYELSNNYLMKKAMKSGGVLALGKAMVVKTPQIVMGGIQNPSFPTFLKISYLQDLIERHLLPVLDNVQAAAERMEKCSDVSMMVNVDDDRYEVDKGEIYLFDASINMLRAFSYLFCTYDMDLFTSSTMQNYSWVDTLINNRNESRHIYSISGDTLIEITSWIKEKKNIQTLVNMMYYNIEERKSFMTIRRSFHDVAFNCLKAVPYKIKNGIAAIKAESDDQNDDILKISMIDSANNEMLDLSSEIRNEGFSLSFAQNFSSIEKLMDFIIQLQTGPYTFNETINGKNIDITIDLRAMFENPVNDLRTLLPEYSWTNEGDWVKSEIDKWDDGFYQKRYIYNVTTGRYDTLYYITNYDTDNEPIFTFDESLIDSMVDGTGGETKYYIHTPIRYHITIDSSYYFNALRLKDGNGNAMSNETIDSLIQEKDFLPYFNDYTFNGLFPGMNREKWLEMIWGE